MEMNKLNQEELNELLGGETEETAGNNKNKNNQTGCWCLFYDGPSVVNKNKKTPCSCVCNFLTEYEEQN
jgi:hypothetical protein